MLSGSLLGFAAPHPFFLGGSAEADLGSSAAGGGGGATSSGGGGGRTSGGGGGGALESGGGGGGKAPSRSISRAVFLRSAQNVGGAGLRVMSEL